MYVFTSHWKLSINKISFTAAYKTKYLLSALAVLSCTLPNRLSIVFHSLSPFEKYILNSILFRKQNDIPQSVGDLTYVRLLFGFLQETAYTVASQSAFRKKWEHIDACN